MKKQSRVIIGIIIILTFAVLAWLFKDRQEEKNTSVIPNPSEQQPKTPSQNEENGEGEESPDETANAPRLETLATNLQIPWAIEFLPDDRLILTERAGQVKTYDLKTKKITTIGAIEGVHHTGEGGLHGVALAPSISSDEHLLYFYHTYLDGGSVKNKVVRYKLVGNTLTKEKDIIANIPGGTNHNGGRIKFGPDGMLYIGAGDAGSSNLAQNTDSLAGKILRLTPEGEFAEGNPFNNATWSYGHRNPQGLVWDIDGNLWETEHGPNARDEVNKIVKGSNYGWPQISGNGSREGMTVPFIHSNNTTWAPSGMTIIEDTLYFVGLRGSSLFKLNTKTKQLDRYLQNEFGRLREVVLGDDGLLYILTNNRDGRGSPSSDDDKLIRVNPSKL